MTQIEKMHPKGRILHRVRQAGANFDLIEPEIPVETLFADGIGQTMIGPAMSKLSFFLIEAAEPERDNNVLVESRVVNMKLAIPTQALVEFCVQTLKNLKINEQAFDDYSATTVAIYKNAANSLK